ncbi:VOC family protein [Nocardioides sp. Bht2]|uniref:VOC family protein n=1 Tax=Nocardioides sp. Bht2 TaxID=3392297 RepID=UPI0039B567CA
MTAAFRTGEPAWVELCSSAPQRSGAFYSALFGWGCRTEPLRSGDYLLCHDGADDVAGIIDADLLHSGRQHGWITYFAVDDLENALSRAQTLGGTVQLEPRYLPAAGTGATVLDPTGATLGLYQAETRTGVARLNALGTLCWNELATGDPDGSADFYQGLFGFDREERESARGQRYSVLSLEGDPVAGLLAMESAWPNEVPARWMPYFRVADLASSIARVRELGGTSLLGPVPSPYGPLHVVDDPDENPLYLIELTAPLRRDSRIQAPTGDSR